jgi:hypothetical protein
MAEASAAQTRVPPLKLLGAGRALVSLGCGAVLGVVTGFAVSAIFWSAASTDSLRTGLIVMSLFFGLFFGPLLTLMFVMVKVTAFAQDMAKRTVRSALEHGAACLSSADFAAAGWAKLLMFSILGLAAGIGVGFIAGTTYVQILPAGDAIIFLFALLGGVVGVLTALSVLVGRETKRRIGKGA